MIKEKAMAAMQKIIKKVSPEVQKEIKQATNKTVNNLKDNLFTILAVTGLGIGLLSGITPRHSTILSSKIPEDLGRNIYFVYNEVHNSTTNNYYTKGDVSK